MNLAPFTALAVRLFAISLAIYTLNNAIKVNSYIQASQSDYAAVTYIGTVISLALLSFVLWKFPLLVARGISNFSPLDENELDTPASDKLLQTGLIILGFYFLFYVVSDLFYWGFILISIQREVNPTIEFSTADKASIFTTIVEMIFVLFLIFGSKVIVQAVNKLRYGTTQ
jgi:hypothetical protein